MAIEVLVETDLTVGFGVDLIEVLVVDLVVFFVVVGVLVVVVEVLDEEVAGVEL
ncbi:MAG: hypothetical protein ACKOXT_00365 [Actinomycetota bacterium]